MFIQAETKTSSAVKGIAKKISGTAIHGSAVIAQVHDLAWTGQHVKAIELASQGLSTSKIKINEQMDLLDLRAESYIAQARLDLAAKDADAMVKLAKSVGAGSPRPALAAQALNRKAIIQMRRGEIKPAIKTVTAALKAAKQSKHKALEAESLLILGEAQFRASLNEQSVKSGQQAADLFEALKNPSGQGRAYRVIAIAQVYLGNEEKSRIAAKTALALCQQAGDQIGIGNALNAITFTEADVAKNIKLLNQARQAFESAGYLERLVAITANLGNQYLSLGLFQRARRFRLQDVQFSRQIGDRWGLTNGLTNLASLETQAGHLDAARSVFIEFKEIALALDNPNFLVNMHSLPGTLAMKEGNPQSAIRHYKKALRVSQEAELLGQEIGALADLGEAHLAAGDPTKALTFTTRATKLHRAQGSGAFEGFSPANVYWQHSRALTANKKSKEARTALEQAYQFLLEGITTLSDEGFRRNYLNKDRISREILETWIQDGKKKKLAPEKLYAHLAVEADVREPFKRLADTGLRLNALKTVSEIQTFLVEEATELSGGERVLLILEKDGGHEVTESILPNGEDAQKVLRGIEAHLAQARRSRIAQLVLPAQKELTARSAKDAKKKKGLLGDLSVLGGSKIVAPLIAQNQVIGYLYADMDSLYGTFNEVDRDMLGMLANQAAVALDNAQWAQGLEQKVEERTAELQASNANLEERNSELAIINSVQEGLASKLDMQAIYDLVGNKIRDIFDAQGVAINFYDRSTNYIHTPYYLFRGARITELGFELGRGLTSHLIQTAQPLVINENAVNRYKELGAVFGESESEDSAKSWLGIPLIIGDQVTGTIQLENYEREHAFSESDVRLLTTLANAMSVALENARLFDETQRLLKITEERNAELAVINSVQAALAAKLDMQAIYDAVGDKIQEIFDAQVVDIGIYDRNEKLLHFPYTIERGVRFPDEPMELIGFRKHAMESRQPLLINQDMGSAAAKYGNPLSVVGEIPKSDLFMPMLVGGEAVGVLSLQNLDHEDAFSESDVSLLTTLTNAMSVALENARLFDETQRLLKITEERAQELAVINSVQAALAAELNIQGIYDAVGDKIREIFNQADVAIRIYDPQTNLIHYPYAYESGERITIESYLLPERGLAPYVLRTRETLVINENLAQTIEKYGGYIIPGTELEKSAVYVPLVAGEQARGMVDLVDMQREYAFSESDVRLLTTLANAMSVALENARLFDETQRLLKVTEERAAELSAISKVSQALIVESELDSTIQLIGSQMREIFSADIVYLALLNPQTNLIHFPYQYGESFEPLTLGEGLTSNIIRTGEPLLINQNLNERTAEIGATRVGKEALSYLGVPIKTGKGTIGVISVQSTTQEGIFTDDSLRLLTTIAANAGAALHNAQLFSEALENLRQVEILTNAASAIELSAYEPAMVESVAARTDALGELARVFAKMADEVRMREQRLKRQLAQMQLDIEEKKLAKAETVAIYIPMDRRQAMAQHVSLPERAHGAALFADVSGFTTLTESLANELGLQRGAEEMIRHLNRVFTVLIDEVHRYSGAVISFSGDAITCWFDDLDLQGNPRTASSLERAAACAFAMQKGMTQFAAISTPNGKTIGLSIKVALAVGPTRRMAVGDGSTHQIDVLAGATLTALANAEHESERGEVVLATANLSAIDEKFNVAAWREEKQFAVLTSSKNEIAPSPWAEIGADAIIKSRLRSWMHPTVFEKVRAGQSEMLSELRPATALFMKFGGLDYDNDPQAEKKLNAFMQWVEGVIAPHNGSIIQFTVGDKGSYIYIVFGAPIAHRDDAAQAVFTALELASPPESLSYMTDLFIGLASGQMRVGAYGGAGHRTYGAIGDRTNLAARLMVAASVSTAEIPAGQRAMILCNESVYDAAKAQAEFESMPRINVKGKTETIAIYRPLRKLSEHEINSDGSFEHTQRIDDLPADEQLTLKVASVIGQMFTLESLSAIYPEKHTNAALQKQLQTLSDLGLIHKRPNEASSYNFKDQQTHEAAYNLMLFAQRRQLHRAVAELLEQTVFSVPPYAEIAHHWQAANEIPKAIEYLEKAGEHARQMGDIDEATRFFNESLGLNQ